MSTPASIDVNFFATSLGASRVVDQPSPLPTMPGVLPGSYPITMEIREDETRLMYLDRAHPMKGCGMLSKMAHDNFAQQLTPADTPKAIMSLARVMQVLQVNSTEQRVCMTKYDAVLNAVCVFVTWNVSSP